MTMGGIDGSPRSYSVVDLGPHMSTSVRLEAVRCAGVSDAPRETSSELGQAAWPRWRTALPRGTQAGRLGLDRAGETVFVASHQFGGDSAALVAAVSVMSGEVMWSRALESPAQTGVLMAAHRASGEEFVVLALSNGRVVCLAAAGGRSISECTLPGWPDRWLYAHPFLAEHDGTAVIIIPQPSGMNSIELSTGSLCWSSGEQWEATKHIRQWPENDAADGDGSCYVVSTPETPTFAGRGPHGFRCLAKHRTSDGACLWEAQFLLETADSALLAEVEDDVGLHQTAFASPVLCCGLVVVGGMCGSVIALDPASGARVWQAPACLREGVGSASKQPGRLLRVYEQAINLGVSGDTVLVSSTTGHLVCIDGRDGATLWTFEPAGGPARKPLVETVPYVRGRGNVLTPALPLTSAGDQKKLVLGGACGRLFVLAAGSGELLVELELGSAVLATPLVHADGAVTVADFDGRLHHWPAGSL
eukprot:SAG22_NODE_1563_length_4114_cov_6.143711_2_plen_476_part_00